jgi:hypothetical protein
VIAVGPLVVVTMVAVLGCGSTSEHSPSPPSQSADQGPRVEKAIWGPLELPDGASAFSTYGELGVDVFQTQLRWAEIAPTRPDDPRNPDDPAYSWPSDLDGAIREASDHGIQVAILVTTTPGWANGGRAEIRAPDHVADYASFLVAASRRFPSVKRWMVWGEPNRSDRFLPNLPNDPVGPRRYAELLDSAYGALKGASPDDLVIGGMTYTGGDVKPPDFIRWMKLPSGRPPRLDLFGADPYPFRLPNLADPPVSGGWRDLSDVDTLEKEVDAAYRPAGIRPPLWLSEFTVQSGEDSRYFAFHVDEDEQALWLTRGYEVANQAENVAGLGWFTLLDRPAGNGNANWGLLKADGSRKPAFRAYASILGR